MNARTALLALFVLFYTTANSQVTKVKYGKVSSAELEMSSYEPDSTANAVILYDNGYFNATNFNFSRHVRIKILTKEGTSWANWTLRTPSKSMIKAIVFNKDGDLITETKLDRGSIFEEEIVAGSLAYKFFLEGVKEGSVIDLEYSFPGLPYEFRFQHTIPVAFCELEIQQSTYINFDKRFYGFHPLKTISSNHWIATNVPAFVPEPYLSDYTNYITKIQFEISSITFPGFYRFYSETWDQVVTYLTSSSYFLGSTSNLFLNEKAKELKEMDTTLIAKITLAQKYVQENISWNGASRLYLTSNYTYNFKKLHSGNSAEVNLSLLFLLLKAGLPAQAVVLSTRDNGIIVPFYPSLDNLNYVVVLTSDGEKEILVDATEKHLIPGVLPERCLNGQGLIIDKSRISWIDLQTRNSVETSIVQIKINEFDEWSAEVRTTKADYAYHEWAKKYEDFKDEQKYMAYVDSHYPDFAIEEYSIYRHYPEKMQITETLKVNLSDYVDDLGNEVFIKPLFLLANLENPFKKDERKYPIDFAFPTEKNITMMMSIPENYLVKSIPQSIKISLPENGGEAIVLFQQTNNNIQIQYKFRLRKSLYTEAEYQFLRNFYSAILDKVGESIKLAKT